MRRWSLRKRLVLGSVSLLALALLLAAIASVALFQTFQIRQMDEQLRSPFGEKPPAQLQGWLEQACRREPGVAAPQLPTSFAVGVFDGTGALTCQLPGGDRPSPRWSELEPVALASHAADETVLSLGSLATEPGFWRARVFALEDGYVVIAESTAEILVAARRLALICLSVGVVILGIATIAGVALVRLGLRPLTEIERTAGEIAAGDFSSRISLTSSETEVGRLAASLNAMLAQIEVAFGERDRTEQRLRRFVADASHELRTPLATIRGNAELVRTGVVAGPDEVSRVLGRIESESIRMAALVEDLLLLARLDTTRVLERRPVDLLTVAADAAADAAVLAPHRRISVRNPVEPPWHDSPPIALGDDARLRQVVTNLVGNAVQHTPSGTAIEIEVGVRDHRVELAVVDHGPGLLPGNEERVFERFYREDPGRGRSRGGTGLGLAIASALAEKHGGNLSYQPTTGGGSTFRLSLPAEAPPSDADGHRA